MPQLPHKQFHQPRKRFGQHFLKNPAVIAEMIACISPNTNDRLVEIGPGLGALTLALLECVPRLTVIELDQDVIPRLQAAAQGKGDLTVVAQDVLRVDFSQFAQDGPFRLVGNLPYNISSPLLFHCFDYLSHIRDMHFMLQKEVVDRMTAQPNSSTYGRLSVMVQYHCLAETCFHVPPDAFYPPPKVDSSVVRLLPLPEAHPIAQLKHLVPYAKFEQIVRLAFGQRRKTLKNALSILPASFWESAPVPATVRAENVSVESFILLTHAALPYL